MSLSSSRVLWALPGPVPTHRTEQGSDLTQPMTTGPCVSPAVLRKGLTCASLLHTCIRLSLSPALSRKIQAQTQEGVCVPGHGQVRQSPGTCLGGWAHLTSQVWVPGTPGWHAYHTITLHVPLPCGPWAGGPGSCHPEALGPRQVLVKQPLARRANWGHLFCVRGATRPSCQGPEGRHDQSGTR